MRRKQGPRALRASELKGEKESLCPGIFLIFVGGPESEVLRP